MKVYRRGEAGAWHVAPDVYRDGESFELSTLSTAISVHDVYDGIIDTNGRSLLR